MRAAFILSMLVIASNAYSATPAEELAQAAAKPSCCQSLSSIAQRRVLRPEQTLSLGSSTPHFDFGWGNTPFAIYSINPSAVRVVELQAASNFAFGRSVRRFPASKVIFFDEDWNQMAYEPLSTPHLKEVGFTKSQVLTDRVRVPEKAVAMVIAADVQRVGLRAQTTEHRSSSTFAASGLVAETGGSVNVVEYELLVYGSFDILSFAPYR